MSYLALGVTALIVLLGAAGMIEMVYHLKLNAALGPQLQFLGTTLDASSAGSWFGCAFVVATGLGLFEVVRRHFKRQWGEIQEFIEKEIKRKEAL
jgi:branched-chain amino acid transport system permease protein